MPNRQVLELFLRQVGLEVIERHFCPEETVGGNGPRSLVKVVLLAAVKAVGAGDREGASRIYVLRKTLPQRENPPDVY